MPSCCESYAWSPCFACTVTPTLSAEVARWAALLRDPELCSTAVIGFYSWSVVKVLCERTEAERMAENVQSLRRSLAHAVPGSVLKSGITGSSALSAVGEVHRTWSDQSRGECESFLTGTVRGLPGRGSSEQAARLR